MARPAPGVVLRNGAFRRRSISMVLQLPRCAECGASIRSRDDDEYRFCGTVLPWELWDEISSTRIELVEVDTLTFEAAIHQVERSRELAGKVVREKLKEMRMRPKLRRVTEDGVEVGPILALGLVVAAPSSAVIGYLLIGELGALLTPAALMLGITFRDSRREDAEKKRSRRKIRRDRKTS
jgi:hypothetical protein